MRTPTIAAIIGRNNLQIHRSAEIPCEKTIFTIIIIDTLASRLINP
jgi:hypothetical protein